MRLRKILVFLIFIVLSTANGEQRKLIIATLEYPPFIYSDNNQIKGVIVEKVRKAFDQLGIDVIINVYPISRGLLMVQNGEVDAFFSLKRTTEREEYLLFTNEPLIRQPFVFFARSDSKIQWNGNLDEIKNYRIGIVSKTSYGTVFDNYLKKGLIPKIDEAQTFEQNINKLIAGRVDLVINSYDVGQNIAKSLHAGNQIIALSPPVETVNSYLAFTKVRDYSELAKKFDAILSAIK